MATIVIANLASWGKKPQENQQLLEFGVLLIKYTKYTKLMLKKNGRLEVHVFTNVIVFNWQLSCMQLR